METNKQLLEFIKNSPSMFHAIDNLKGLLLESGYEELIEASRWELKEGGKYFVIRNGSSIIAFNIAEKLTDYHFQISASHSDSPTFKLKEIPDFADDHYTKLNVEGYGGMLCSTFFDRPLSIAGRVLVRENNHFTSKLVNIDRDLLVIPNLAIHMNREANKGVAYNNQVDMLPLFAGSKQEGAILDLVAKEAGCSKDMILAHDLYLYNRSAASNFGYEGEFIASPKLDNLECAFATTKAFTKAISNDSINIVACFDNEEVGSGTKQGAGSTFLLDVLKRINTGLNKTDDEYYEAVAKSFMVSADNAHAVHPNHPELADKRNNCYMNGGVVIKYSANQKYTTDAISSAIIEGICDDADVPHQYFANRSDMAGGSTLGNISSAQVSLHTVDIGLAQLAMHSSYEIGGAKDCDYMIKAMTKFYSSNIVIKNNNDFEVNYK